jgi:hypothetical protein
MPVERTLAAYREEHLNCAQSVLRGFQPHRNIPEDDIIAARALGGGRAEAGLCGALYTALQLAGGPESRQRLQDAFTAGVGSDKCRDIRRAARVPCVECVRIAASLLVEHGCAGPSPADGTKAGQP